MIDLWRNYTTKQWSHWWQVRQIDWKKEYQTTWNHPHRTMITRSLANINFLSLLEVGCGAGANLINIVKHLPGKQLGGIDINPEAIKEAQEMLNGAFLKVSSVEDIMMSDNSTDIVLSDMTLIYFGGKRLDAAIEEIKRVSRHFVFLSEFHSTSWYDRMKLWLTSGLHAHDYQRLLEKHGFYDVSVVKAPAEAWPDGDETQRSYATFILARVPKRK